VQVKAPFVALNSNVEKVKKSLGVSPRPEKLVENTDAA
jgi:hypothetical protein